MSTRNVFAAFAALTAATASATAAPDQNAARPLSGITNQMNSLSANAEDSVNLLIDKAQLRLSHDGSVNGPPDVIPSSAFTDMFIGSEELMNKPYYIKAGPPIWCNFCKKGK